MYISERWLALAGTCFVVLCLFLFFSAVHAHDHTRPDLTEWYMSLHARGGAWCCNGDDAETVEEWESVGGHYRAKVADTWIAIPDAAIIDGPNRAGQAKIWLMHQDGELAARCFIPGAMI